MTAINPAPLDVRATPSSSAMRRSAAAVSARISPAAMAAAIALPAAAALLAAWATPRGPVTALHVIGSVIVAMAVGAGAGRLLRSRWSVVLAPAVFMLVFELARLPVSGPTVDAIALDSMYGILAFVGGRGLHAVLVLIPMALGAVFGVELAARARPAALSGERAGPRRMGPIGWLVAGTASVLVLAIAAVLVMPGSTAPILGPHGAAPAGSIAELRTIHLGGKDQTVMVRGRSVENPVLLYLAGGPGGTDLGAMRADVGMESDFVVVTWEQRGTGKSYAGLDPLETINVHGMVADTLELTNLLRAEFEEDRIYIVGNSWGTTLGTIVAQQQPELFHAYVGTGQMVSQRETDRMFYEDTLAWARATGDTGLVAKLEALGPPPYADIRGYEYALSHEHDWNPYTELDLDKEMPGNLFVPENSWLDRLNAFRGFLDTFAALYPQLQEVDFRADVPSLELPVYLVVGAHEARGRAVLADEWFGMLDAPAKTRIEFAHSGHRPQFEEPAEFVAVMQRVLEETYPNR